MPKNVVAVLLDSLNPHMLGCYAPPEQLEPLAIA